MALPVVLLTIAGFLLFSNPVGLSTQNLTNILRIAAVAGLPALAMTLTIIAGGVDFSVGGVVALSGIIFAMSIEGGGGLLGGLVNALIASAIFGVIQGTLIAYLRAPSYMITVAGLAAGQSIAILITDARVVRLGEFSSLDAFGRGGIGFLPYAFVTFLVIAGVVDLAILRTPLGRDLRALGQGARTRQSEKTLTIVVYVLSSLLAGGAGLLLTIRLGVGQPTVGQDMLLIALASALIGGAMIGRGRGSVIATVIATLAVVTLQNAAILAGWSGFSQPLILVGLIVFALVRNMFQ
jgi:ribose transport system permease protein